MRRNQHPQQLKARSTHPSLQVVVLQYVYVLMLHSVVLDYLLLRQPVVKSWSKPTIEADTPKPGEFPCH